MNTLILAVFIACGALPAGAQSAAQPGAPSGAAAGPGSAAPGGGGFPAEVDITGKGGVNKLDTLKPPLAIEVDPFETIRPSLEPDPSLLLAVSPLTVSWRRTHPDVLQNPRTIQPWRLTFSQRPGIAFRVREQLFASMGRKMEPKEAKAYGWSLTIADEEGRVFHHYEGSSDPPEELTWSGQNDQGEWIKAGRSYSAVYTFTDSTGSPHTSVGRPVLFKGIVHQEDTGLYVTLDSSVLFGAAKSGTDLAARTGTDLLRSAADLIKRRYSGIPVAVRVFANTKELADSQGKVIQSYLIHELMTMSKNVSTEWARAAFSDQRVEIVLLNR